jgi:hypothetical protein
VFTHGFFLPDYFLVDYFVGVNVQMAVAVIDVGHVSEMFAVSTALSIIDAVFFTDVALVLAQIGIVETLSVGDNGDAAIFVVGVDRGQVIDRGRSGVTSGGGPFVGPALIPEPLGGQFQARGVLTASYTPAVLGGTPNAISTIMPSYTPAVVGGQFESVGVVRSVYTTDRIGQPGGRITLAPVIQSDVFRAGGNP